MTIFGEKADACIPDVKLAVTEGEVKRATKSRAVVITVSTGRNFYS